LREPAQIVTFASGGSMNEDRRVFITGASTGLGEGLAAHYAREGAVLGLVARRKELLDALRAKLEAKGATVHTYALDVTDTEAMKNAALDFMDKAGGIDLVIANAGVGTEKGAIARGDSAAVSRTLSTNLLGVSNTLVPFVPTMIAQKRGTLAAVSSFAGTRAVPGHATYCASKAGVTTFMDGLRLELKQAGVHAVALAPGYVHTPLTAGIKSLPFVIDVDEAVRQMSRAIARKTKTFIFPWQIRWLALPAVKLLPEWLLLKVMPPPRIRG